MSRRAAALITLLVAGLIVALLPWTVTSERVRAAVARQIRDEYGLNLSIGGRATVSLLPVPRLKLADVTFADAAGIVSARAMHLKGELRIASLLFAKLRLSEVRITGARIEVSLDRAADETVGAALDRIRQRLARSSPTSSHIDRLVVTGSDVEFRAREARISWRKLNVVARWPDPGGDIEVTGSADWEGETVSLAMAGLNPALLLSGTPDAVEMKIGSRLGRLSGIGNLTWGEAPRFQGLLSGQAASLGALARWTGLGLDLQDFDQAVAFSGDCVVDPNGIEWPRVQLDLGRDRLEGALAYQVDGPRPQARATLAGDDLDLGWILPIANPNRADRPRADYDVRLSAIAVRMGPLRLRDVATGILVSGERLEVSLARATLAGGTVRGRISAALDGEGRDIRGQMSVDKVDLDKLLAETGLLRGITGTLGGQISFETPGEPRPDLARHLKGRLTMTARDGEISGVALGEPPRPSDTRAPGTVMPIGWRAGRTRFGQVAVTLEMSDGLAEITEGTIDTAATQTKLKGSISLPDGMLALRTTTWGLAASPTAEPRPVLTLDVRGPLDHLTVTAADGSADQADNRNRH